MSKKLCVIGEALIDFIPEQSEVKLKDVTSFKKVAGGAPLNVATAYKKLGLDSLILTQLGDDAFGHYILDVCKKYEVDTSKVKLSSEHETSLAFVSLTSDGNREFKFYRKNSADLNFCPNDIPDSVLDDCGVIHFCSVSLVESFMKTSHDKLIKLAEEKNKIISFDPNLRFSLWDNLDELKSTVNKYIKLANIIKISDDELEFIFGTNNILDVLPILFDNKCKILIYTKGGKGAEIYTHDTIIKCDGIKVNVVDTTGAGDSFIGAFLNKMMMTHNTLDIIDNDALKECLEYANCYAAYTTTKYGALESMATVSEINDFKKMITK